MAAVGPAPHAISLSRPLAPRNAKSASNEISISTFPSSLGKPTIIQLIHPPRHYSYQCKTPAQDRPYTARPSRTQQLRNPRLQPQLHATLQDTIAAEKKRVVDDELARREAERQRQREKQEQEDRLLRDVEEDREKRRKRRKRTDEEEEDRHGRSHSHSHRRRKRSVSISSVDTISTGRGSPAPERQREDQRDRKDKGKGRDRYRDHRSGAERRRTPNRSVSPPLHRRNRSHSPVHLRHNDYQKSRSRSLSVSPRVSPREQSLSPYSRRVALTRAMQQQGR